MTALLDPRSADKLVRIAGMFGSDHDGERAAAAAKADQLIRSHGLTWREVIRLPVTAPESLSGLIGWCLANGDDVLNAWERCFLAGLHAPLSPKQKAKLDAITTKVRAYRAAGGDACCV
jgi:hypothetical protein